jgi:transposase
VEYEQQAISIPDVALMARRPFKVALANKIARTIWASLVKGGIYQAPPAMAKA